MKFDSLNGNRRSRRQSRNAYAPALIESLESRALLAGPQVLSPTGTISEVRPVITWEAVDSAVSYDVWVSDVETRERLLLQQGVTGTNLTSPVDFSLGRNRIWVQANFANNTTSGWGLPTDVTLQVVPTITGPINTAQPATPQKLNERQPTITWTSPTGARTFEIFISNQTEQTSVTYRVQNRQPALDSEGNPIPDGNGGVVLQETRSFELPEELSMGQYRVFMRTIDDGGRISPWTAAYQFEVAPAVEILRPSGPSFENQPLLQWKAVPDATHYEVWVSKVGSEQTPLYSAKYLTSTSYQIPRELDSSDYVFWVRARRLNQVTEVKIGGAPTSGSFQIALTTFGTGGTTVQTGLIPFDATQDQVRQAIADLPGFSNVEVISSGTSPLQTHLIQIPQMSGQVKVVVTGTITGGTLTSTTRTSPEVVGLWSARTPFSSLRVPVITAPVGVPTNNPTVRTVTGVRPTIEWTAIDKAARYEIWVDRTASSSTYLRTTSTTNSYTFESDILAGNYWVWVRAISTRGVTTAWSQPYTFTATGGAPLILSPQSQQTVFSLPTFTWTDVPDAVSYEIHLAWLNVDFDYIQASGITQTEYTPNDPLEPGSYRLWVRAIRADGSVSNWSTQVTFSVVGAELPEGDVVNEELLAVLESPLAGPQQSVETGDRILPPTETGQEQDDASPLNLASADVPVTSPSGESTLGQVWEAELIELLAERFVEGEWWMSPENTATSPDSTVT
jgi:hypothetical protein